MDEFVGILTQWGSTALLVVFALFVLSGLIFGLIRGWKRSLMRFCLILVCIILAAGLSPLFYYQALETDISSIDVGIDLDLPEGNLGEVIEGFIEENLQMLPLDKLQNTVEAVLMVSSIFLNLIIFVALFASFRFLSWILFGILKLIFFGGDRKHKKAYKRYMNGNGPEVKPYKKGRFVGGLIGMVQGVAILLVFVVLITAPLNAYNAFVTATGGVETLKAKDGEEKNIFDVIDAFNEAYNNSIPAVVYTQTGIDKLIYDMLTTVKIGAGENVETFSLESIGTLAGTVMKAMNSLMEFPDIADKEAFEDYLDVVEDLVEVVFGNGLVRIFINDIGVAIGQGLVNLEDILSGLGGQGDQDDTNGVSLVLVSSEDEEATEGGLGSMVIPMLLELINDLSSKNDLASSLKAALLDIVDVAKDLNNDGTLATIANSMSNPEELFEDLPAVKNVGKALDKILGMETLDSAKNFIFGMFSEMVKGPFAEFGVDMDDVQLDKIKWESMMETFYEFLQIDDISAIDGDTVVNLITTLEGQWVESGVTYADKDPSGIIRAFESIFKTVIAQMNLGSVDEDFLADKNLDLIENKQVIGAMLDLMNDKALFDDLNDNASNLTAKSEENLEAIDKLSAHLKKMENATPDFKAVLREVISVMMGGINVGSDPIKTISKSLDAFKLIIDMSNMVADAENIASDIASWDTLNDTAKNELLDKLQITDSETIDEIKNLPPEEAQSALMEKLFDEDKAETLIDLVADDGILNMIESSVGETSIDLGNNKAVVEDTLDKIVGDLVANQELEQEEIEEKLAQYERLAGLLGLDTSNIPNFPQPSNP